MYTFIKSEAQLWTVGFTKPDNGTWEPESDHSGERAAKQRAHELNGVEARYVYLRTEPGLWTVGSYSPGCRFESESDHGSWSDAAARTIDMNA